MTAPLCVLCGKPIRAREAASSYRIDGECLGFTCEIHLTKHFHDACVIRPDGVNEVARAQVLDYLEQVTFTQSDDKRLREQNMERLQKIEALRRWRGGTSS